jgi:DNA mismatch repair protein MutL
MNVINLLSEHISNQIAAGEVIQRPASVVKELLENAIDAGATEIKVFIKDGGRTNIVIQDNGKGMTPDDAILSFKRHSTSKLKNVDDLFKMQTKGFRGEALASIAAIAQVTMKTKHMDSNENGFQIEYAGGKLTEKEECVCDTGTTIEVKNIFFNVPARRSFLKSDTAEFNHIRHEFERIAMAHNEVKLSLTQNEVEIYNLPESNIRKRITDVLGKNSNEKLVPISEETDIISITGFVGKPENAKKSRGEQYFFVNKRFFKHAYFHHAIAKAFTQLIPEKTHPSYFVFFDINPAKIDINVHPTKTEINFEESKFIYSILLSSIKQALGKYNISPTIDFDVDHSFDVPPSKRNTEPKEPEIKVNPSYNPFSSFEKKNISHDNKSSALNKQGFGHEHTPKDWQNFYEIQEESEKKQNELIDEGSTYSKQDFLIRERYIITNSKSGILVIDSKRARQRMIYDEMMRQFVSAPLDSQKLLFPLEVELNKDEHSSWKAAQSLLKQLGFHFNAEDSKIVFDNLPACLDDNDSKSCIDSITKVLMQDEAEKGELAHEIVINVIQTSGPTIQFKTNEEIKDFIETLFSHSDHSFCPNGKPIMQTITLEELTSNF